MIKASDKYLLQKFNREFEQICKDLFSDSQIKSMVQSEDIQEEQQFSPAVARKEHSLSADGKLMDYGQFKQLAVGFGLLNERGANMVESVEWSKLLDLWKVAQGGEYKGSIVPSENIRVVFQVISRLIDAKRILNVPSKADHAEDGQRSETNTGSYIDHSESGFYNSKNEFCLKMNEVPKLQNYFNVFYLNRLQF